MNLPQKPDAALGRLERIVMCNAEHEPNTKCLECGAEVDDYGNTENDFRNCCFPDCGCDGNRNCVAPSGANYGSMTLNLEKRKLKDGYYDYT